MLGLTLGIRIPSDTLNNALSPPSFEVERFEICKIASSIDNFGLKYIPHKCCAVELLCTFQLWVRFSLLVICDRRAIPVIGGIAMRLIVAHV